MSTTPDTPLEDGSNLPQGVYTIETYKDHGGDWRWRLKAGNNEIIASSGESFDSHGNAKLAGQRMASIVGKANDVVVEDRAPDA